VSDDKGKPVNDVPDSIRKHQPKATLEMKGPDGASIRKAQAEAGVKKDWDKYNSDRALKYASMDKKPLVTKEDVREGKRGILSQEHQKAR